ncbi:hypothetical protein pipiens_019898, partial [Culex pipiens pipiens]
MTPNRLVRLLAVVLLVHRSFCARDPPTVEIPGQGMVMGTFMKMFRTQRVVAYLGIPYAQAPINEKRFTPPVVDNLPAWEGTRKRIHLWAPVLALAAETHRRHNQLFLELIQAGAVDEGEKQYDEDCLFLNIYVPD